MAVWCWAWCVLVTLAVSWRQQRASAPASWRQAAKASLPTGSCQPMALQRGALAAAAWLPWPWCPLNTKSGAAWRPCESPDPARGPGRPAS